MRYGGQIFPLFSPCTFIFCLLPEIAAGMAGIPYPYIPVLRLMRVFRCVGEDRAF